MVITLCGSARFEPWYKAWNLALTMAGHAVFTLTVYPSERGGEREWYTEAQKLALDAAHFRKIAASDAVLVLNPFAYLGPSTLREIAEAERLGKRVVFLQSWGKGCGIGPNHNARIRMAARAYGVPEGFGSPLATSMYQGPYDLLGPGGAERSALVGVLAKREEEAIDSAINAAREEARP